MTTFQDQERYKNDERYAKVWLRYVSYFADRFDDNVFYKYHLCFQAASV